MSFSIIIKSAIYGADGNTVDVTEGAQNGLRGDDLTITPETFGIDDPDPGVQKHCGIHAEITSSDGSTTQFYYMAKDYDVVDLIP